MRRPRLAVVAQGAPAASTGRRELLAALAAAAATGLRAGAPARAAPLRSLQSSVPAVVTFRNELDRDVKIYWINYSGDPELFARMPPASW